MGRYKFSRILVSLLIINNVALQSHAADDGLVPITPVTITDDIVVIPTPGAEEDNKGNNKDNKSQKNKPPRTPVVKARGDSRGFSVDPVTIGGVAEVSEEFACPLFESRAYENILESLNKLNDAVKTSVQCPNAPTLGNITENTEKIKSAIESLKPFFEEPEKAYGNVKGIEESIAKAVLGVDSIAQTLSNPTFTNTPCGQNMTQNGVVTAVSNLITSLGPYVLLGVSLAPGLSLAIKGGALGVIAGASAYNELNKLVLGRNLDMSNHEHWRSVVQNTCAYSRVAKKLNYIERHSSNILAAKESTPIDQLLPEEIQSKTISFQRKYGQRQDSLGQYIAVSLSDKQVFNRIATTLRESRAEVKNLSAQMGSSKENPEVACTIALEIASSAKSKNGFPTSLMTSLNSISKHKGVNLNAHIGLQKTYDRLTNHLQQLSSANLNDINVVKDCAQKADALMDIFNRTIIGYQKTLQEVQNHREADLSKNPEFRRWKEDYQKLETQRRMGEQLYTVMKNVEDAPSTLRSYLNQRQNTLKQALFGSNGWWGSNPPVYAWLDYTLSLHKARVKDFETNMSHMSVNLYNLKIKLMGLHNKPGVTFENKKLAEAFKAATDFNLLDIKNFNLKDPVAAREHQLVCQRLLHTWDAWTAAVNHLDSVGLFCEMIDPMLDLSVDKKIVEFCRGSESDISHANQNQVSKVGLAVQTLQKVNYNYANRNIEQMALLIPGRLKALECLIPSGN